MIVEVVKSKQYLFFLRFLLLTSKHITIHFMSKFTYLYDHVYIIIMFVNYIKKKTVLIKFTFHYLYLEIFNLHTVIQLKIICIPIIDT